MNSFFKKKSYNPDILEALANLSSDEVFTPPKIVNQILDLLPQELFQSKETTFLDPASKSGVFLREIAKRLIKGLEKEIPNLQKRLNHIYTKQLFGIAITDLTALISRRTLYGTKTANGKYSFCTKFKNKSGNIRFAKIEHFWQNGRCKYCGASESEYKRSNDLETHAYEFIHKTPEEIINLFKQKNMKFDVIIGNPPYQLKTAGHGAQAIPVYDKFVKQAKKLNPRYLVMIIPSRWFTGGMGLNDFRKDMLNDERIRELHDFFDAKDVFPGVEIKGGVCYFLWDRDNPGKCRIVSYKDGEKISEMERRLKQTDEDVLIRYNEATSILEKVLKKKERSFSEIVSSQKPFGLPTNFTDFSETKFDGAIKVYANQKVGFINEEKIPQNREWIGKYKIFVPKAIGSGDMSVDMIKPILGEKNSVSTETYILIGPFNARKEAENVSSYINTKFFHFLVGLLKNTQDALRKVYKFVPMQDFSQSWNDKKLYKKYGLTKKEIDFIESMVRPME